MFFISNLVCGLDKGLDNPAFLLETVKQIPAGIEFFIHTYSPAYMKKLETVGEWIKNIPVAVHGPFIQIEATCAQNTKEQDFFIDSYEKAFSFAANHECKHVVFHTNECKVDAFNKDILQKRCLENLTQLIQRAKKHGIRMLVENLGIPAKGLPLFDETEFIALFSRYPDIDCIIDVGHLFLAKWNINTVLSALAGNIKAYHLHNNDGQFDSHRRITDGNFDFTLFYDAYKTYTPNADITLEYGDTYGITENQLAEDAKTVMNACGIS